MLLALRLPFIRKIWALQQIISTGKADLLPGSKFYFFEAMVNE